MTFGEVLHKLQSESGLTQAQVAERINMDQGNYCRLLKAEDMMCSTFKKVCEELGYDMDEACQLLK